MEVPILIEELAYAINLNGGRSFFVGGCVRDDILGLPIKDYDIEVYGIQPEKLANILRYYGKVDSVGQSFQVYKLNNEIDISIPRRERKTGKGHTGFVIEGDPDMSYQEACSRRDFTMNAIMMNILSGEIIDPFNGVEDIKDKIIRHVNDKTFVEDSLRVLRACQFASRFEFTTDIDTMLLCQKINLTDLPKERIREEMIKLLLGKNPMLGFFNLYWFGVAEQLFPQIYDLQGVQQDPIWHPEGDVLIHTGQVLNEARKLINDLHVEEQLIVMLSALCHDFGKPSTTEFIDGRYRAHGHEEAGVEPTLSFLDTIGIDTPSVRSTISAIVANHLAPVQFYKNQPKVGAFRRLANKLPLDLLCLVSQADTLGRWVDDKPINTTEAHDWFRSKISTLHIEKKGPDQILMGRHLIELGFTPSKEFGAILDAVYEKQLDGEIETLDEAIEEVKRITNE